MEQKQASIVLIGELGWFFLSWIMCTFCFLSLSIRQTEMSNLSNLCGQMHEQPRQDRLHVLMCGGETKPSEFGCFSSGGD